MTATTEQISRLLHEAGETHHRVFRIIDGADDDWASWYSDWLVNLSELPSLLGAKPVRSELTYLLVSLDKDYRQPARRTLGNVLRSAHLRSLQLPRTLNSPASTWLRWWLTRLLPSLLDERAGWQSVDPEQAGLAEQLRHGHPHPLVDQRRHRDVGQVQFADVRRVEQGNLGQRQGEGGCAATVVEAERSSRPVCRRLTAGLRSNLTGLNRPQPGYRLVSLGSRAGRSLPASR